MCFRKNTGENTREHLLENTQDITRDRIRIKVAGHCLLHLGILVNLILIVLDMDLSGQIRRVLSRFSQHMERQLMTAQKFLFPADSLTSTSLLCLISLAPHVSRIWNLNIVIMSDTNQLSEFPVAPSPADLHSHLFLVQY